jgi:hypothetical protein
VVSGPVPAVRSYVPDVPPALDDVCRRALHRDRNRRFRTAAEMAEALERAGGADGFAGVAPPRDLGRFVEATMGPELLAQRDAVRAGLGPNSVASGRVTSSRRISQPPPSTRGGAVASVSEPRPRSQEAPVTPAAVTAPSGSRVDVAAAAKERAPAPESPAPTSVEPPIEETLPAVKASGEEKAAPPQVEVAAAEPAPPARPTPPVVAKAPKILQALLDRLPASRMGKGRVAALALLVLVILSSPIWLKLSNRLLHRRRPHAAGEARPTAAAAPSLPPEALVPEPAALPTPAPRPQRGWDEGDWALPDAGDGRAESAPAPSASPTAKPAAHEVAPAPPAPKPAAHDADPVPPAPPAPKPPAPKPAPKAAPASDPYGD